MQTASKKALVVGALALAVGVVGSVPLASAKSVHATSKTTTHGKSHLSHVKGHKRTLPGTVVSVGTSSFVMKKGNVDYTIDVTSTTALKDHKGNTITLAEIKAGHKVSVRGTVTAMTVTNVLSVRDLSL